MKLAFLRWNGMVKSLAFIVVNGDDITDGSINLFVFQDGSHKHSQSGWSVTKAPDSSCISLGEGLGRLNTNVDLDVLAKTLTEIKKLKDTPSDGN